MKRLSLVVLAVVVGFSGACVSQSKNGLTSLSTRCDRNLDAYGRPTTTDGECRDTNAGTYR